MPKSERAEVALVGLSGVGGGGFVLRGAGPESRRFHGGLRDPHLQPAGTDIWQHAATVAASAVFAAGEAPARRRRREAAGLCAVGAGTR